MQMLTSMEYCTTVRPSSNSECCGTGLGWDEKLESGLIEQDLIIPTLNRRLGRDSYMGQSCVCESCLQPSYGPQKG